MWNIPDLFPEFRLCVGQTSDPSPELWGYFMKFGVGLLLFDEILAFNAIVGFGHYEVHTNF